MPRNPAKKRLLLRQYKGPLTLKQAAAGINLAINNAARLLADARVLLGHGHYPSAAFLAAIAVEEHGKVAILDRLAAAEARELESIWKEYRSHTSKNSRWILPSLVDTGPKTLEQLSSVFAPNSIHQQAFEEIKQLCRYSDSTGEGEWSDPLRFASKELAEQFIDNASRLISVKGVTEEDMALRVRAIRAVKRAHSLEEKMNVFAEYLRDYFGLSKVDVEAILHGKIDLRGAGRKT